MKYLLLAALLITGCKFEVEVRDARLTREEVATALQQRDAALSAISKELKRVREAAGVAEVK